MKDKTKTMTTTPPSNTPNTAPKLQRCNRTALRRDKVELRNVHWSRRNLYTTKCHEQILVWFNKLPIPKPRILCSAYNSILALAQLRIYDRWFEQEFPWTRTHCVLCSIHSFVEIKSFDSHLQTAKTTLFSFKTWRRSNTVENDGLYSGFCCQQSVNNFQNIFGKWGQRWTFRTDSYGHCCIDGRVMREWYT